MVADDYLTKPFQMLELAARVEAVLRRTKKVESEFIMGDLKCDFDGGTRTVDVHIQRLRRKLHLENQSLFIWNPVLCVYGSFPAPWQDYGLMYIGNLNETIQSWRHTKNILF